MNIKALLKDKLLDVPKVQKSGHDFVKFTNDILSAYSSKLQKVSDSQINEIENATDFKDLNRKVIDGINIALREYYDGNPFISYQQIHKILGDYNKYPRIKDISIPSNTDLYRIRIKNENYPLSRKELFHIPFELRGKVQTQRYSIPGFPTLYLSNSVYVCWEELERPDINSIQASLFRSNRNLNVLDFMKPDIYRLKYTTSPVDRELLDYIMIWPLIMASSVQVNGKYDTFKPEYIIPQLLLQWVKQNQKIDGIRYFSNNVDIKEGTKGEFYNIAIPVKQNKSEGYCDRLKELFTMTEVWSLPLHNAAQGNATIIYPHKTFKTINPDIQTLELISGKTTEYYSSAFAKFELNLQSLESKVIDF
jgi:hypothetical protein